MRRIDRAVLQQSIQKADERSALRSDSTKTKYCVDDEFFEEQARKTVIERLSNYIVFRDQDHHYWIDRYWYFDVEKYQRDLEAFGVPVAAAMRDPVGIPREGASDV